MLGEEICRTALFMSETVMTWAMDHLEGLNASSEQKDDPSWQLAFGASYVPSKHVVSSAGAAAELPWEQAAHNAQAHDIAMTGVSFRHDTAQQQAHAMQMGPHTRPQVSCHDIKLHVPAFPLS
jgi:hypothetical protein